VIVSFVYDLAIAFGVLAKALANGSRAKARKLHKLLSSGKVFGRAAAGFDTTTPA
jgi:hypothetical protein